MRTQTRFGLSLLLLLGMIPPVQAEEKPLMLNLMWTYHCPPAQQVGGVYQQPWARLRAVRDLAGMLNHLEKSESVERSERSERVEVSLSLSPVLIEQIKRLSQGGTDRDFQLAEIPSDRLRDAEKKALFDRFFSVPKAQRSVGLRRLRNKAFSSFNNQDWRDLQTLFYLAWMPALPEDDPCRSLERKASGFSEEEKMMVLSRHRQWLQTLLPRLKHLQAVGKIEIAMTPYSHPILPLLLDSSLGRFSWASDAQEQIDEGIKVYASTFGCGPRGMWPPEGAVSPGMAPLVKGVGLRWMATGQGVLAASNDDLEALHPYQVKGGPAVFFRNDRLSEAFRRRYPYLKGENAARELLRQLEQLDKTEKTEKTGEVVTLIVDGSATFDAYQDGGDAFLTALYRGLSHHPRIKTVLPSAYLSRHPIPTLERLASGSLREEGWTTWHGDPAQDRAWRFLRFARSKVEDFRQKHPGDPRTKRALRALYLAEGSDWFNPSSWEWDPTFRSFLSESFRHIDQAIPSEWTLPVLPSLTVPARAPKGGFSPRLDGNLGEWRRSGQVPGDGKNLARLDYDWDRQNLYLGVTFQEQVAPFFSLQFGCLEQEGGKKDKNLPFLSHYRAELSLGGGTLVSTRGGRATDLKVASSKRVVEIKIPWSSLGMKPGEAALMVLTPGGAAPFPAKPLLLTP